MGSQFDLLDSTRQASLSQGKETEAQNQ